MHKILNCRTSTTFIVWKSYQYINNDKGSWEQNHNGTRPSSSNYPLKHYQGSFECAHNFLRFYTWVVYEFFLLMMSQLRNVKNAMLNLTKKTNLERNRLYEGILWTLELFGVTLNSVAQWNRDCSDLRALKKKARACSRIRVPSLTGNGRLIANRIDVFIYSL